jgi:putative glutathione S-transferase
LAFRALKGLEKMIDVSIVDWFMGSDGWTFKLGDGATPDPIHGAEFLHQVYTTAQADYTGRVTVPVLWDKQTGTIVSNESAEIIRMFNSAFDGIGAKAGDYYPEAEREEIDALNARVYDTVNNGVYKAGCATTQEAYEQAVVPLFETLDWLEERLSKRRYLMGDHQTEADWRLWTTLLRFDPVYVGHFKCNLRRIAEYPNLSGYVRDLFQVPGIAETVDIAYIKKHYYGSHTTINPTRVVPMGPVVDYSVPHDRSRFSKES